MILFAVIVAILYVLTSVRAANISVFTKDKSDSLKSVLSIIIVLHHVYLSMGYGFLSQFKSWGAVVVSIFFFISGYGLRKSFSLKGDEYLHGFIKKRILQSILIPFGSILLLQCALSLTFEHGIELTALLKNNGERWFVVTILYLYLTFWLSAKLGSVKRLDMLLFISIMLYYIIMRNVGFDRCWYISVWAFLCGVLYCRYEPCIISCYKDISVLKYISIPILSLTMVGLYVSGAYVKFGSELLYSLVYVIIPVICCVLSTSLKFERLNGSRVLRYLGGISYEIYLCHGVVILFLAKCDVIASNGVWFTILTLLLSVIMASFAKQITLLINRAVNL